MKINRRSSGGWFPRLVSGLLLLSMAPMIAACQFAQASFSSAQPSQAVVTNPIPELAYYYIWYDTSSWDRAKIDYPLLGRYSSDDQSVMRQQIQWAKSAGINGFIVSWKSTDVLNRRLEQLVQIAQEENFKLAIIYQGLDFNRNPLPPERIASDLDFFIQHFATLPVFQIFSKPMVIWSGTWKFTPDQIANVTGSRRKDLLILASERNLDGYTRLAKYVDGDAYYWSSVNPDTYPDYQGKLDALSQAVHQNSGIWIPSAAPGFDAHLIGGTNTVPRKNGETLRVEFNTALSSSPDVIGIISWNEFSENSYIEPSVNYSSQYLNLLSDMNHTAGPKIGEFDSSEPLATYPEWFPGTRVAALGGLASLVIFALVVIFKRRV